MKIVIYDKEHPNPNANSDADGHIFHDDGRVTPIYHESRLHGCMIGMEPVPDHPDYYVGGPK